jgi:hypothetical protein
VTYQVINIDGDLASFEKYGPALTAALKQLEAEFPKDIEHKYLGLEMYTGQKVPWLILDDDGEFVSFCATKDSTNEATGKKSTTLTSHAAVLAKDCVPDMCAVIEAWAFERGADFVMVEGRRDLSPKMRAGHYREYCTVWAKPRPEHREAE